jgi:adhesin/invasin
MTAYKFKNPQDGSDFEDKGNKFGADAKLGNFVIEAGYDSSNREKDNYFGSVKYVVALGDNVKKGYYALSEIKDPITDKKMKDSYRSASLKNLKKAFEYTSVEDKLYQPVKRENKIRVVKISASGFVASGF